MHALAPARSRFAARIAAFYGALFVIYGMHTPYTPVWFDSLGLTAGEISTILAAPFFIRLAVTPGIAHAADRGNAHRLVLICLAWVSLGLALALSQMQSFVPVMLLAVPMIMSNATMLPLTETIAVAAVRDHGADYGRMRLWGSLTFIAASFLGGQVVGAFGGGVGIWLVVFGCVSTVFAARLLPAVSMRADAISTSANPVKPLSLVRNPAFFAFLLASGFVQASHATFLSFGSLIWQRQGFSGAWIGALWAIGVIAEVAVFAQSRWLIDRFGPVKLLIAGSLVAVVRWTVMALSPGLAVQLALQTLHAVTFGASHAAAIHFIHKSVPPQAGGSAQSFYSIVSGGLAMGLATLISGALYGRYGESAYLAMSAFAAIALVASFWLKQLWNGGLLFGHAPSTPAVSPITGGPEEP